MFKRILVVLLVLGVLLPLSSSAQTADPLRQSSSEASEIARMIAELQRQIAELKVKLAQLQGRQSTEWCHTFERNLGVGAGGKEVDALHAVLVKEGISISPLPVPVNTIWSEREKDREKDKATFTEATAAAVSAFQLKYKDEILVPLGLSNPTGYVGPSTRAKMNQLYGCHRIIPPITGNRPPVISAVSGPTSLNVGQTGTWTVRASDPENGQLYYWVIWGDEIVSAPTTTAFPEPAPLQQTATFTHTYSTAGTYNPVFTVTDNSGQSARTSLSVVVGQSSLITVTVTSPNGGEQWVTNSVQPITWRYDDATSATKVDLWLLPLCPLSLLTCAVMPESILDKNIPAQSIYNWIVATDIVNNPIPPGTYKVRVCEAGSQMNCDLSDNRFTILAQ